jgi:hypothetical protein
MLSREKKESLESPMVVVPDDIADEDSLGHGVHADALVEMIRSVASKGSFTIGVYGQWGQGKTSMLRQIQQALNEKVDSPPNIVTVWFNPWQYASDEHLIILFFQTFIAALRRGLAAGESGDGPSGFRKRLETFLKKLVHVPVALAYGLEGEIKIPLLLKSKFSFDKMIDESRRAEEALKEDDASERLPLGPASIDRFESLYYNLLQDLRGAAGAFDTKVSSFKMDRYPVTQSLYAVVASENPSKFKGDDRPVERVSWFEAAEFCNRLSEMCGLPKAYEGEGENIRWLRDSTGFRLPTEAEWEMACRAGTPGERYGELDRIAWYEGNSEGSTRGVGQKEPNVWGLYDMLGNVWEWCWDWYDSYPNDGENDPIGAGGGARRVIRGGSRYFAAERCHSAFRTGFKPDYRNLNVGFRLARSC